MATLHLLMTHIPVYVFLLKAAYKLRGSRAVRIAILPSQLSTIELIDKRNLNTLSVYGE